MGAGARGLAFIETLIQDRTLKVALIDRNKRAGGVWNQTYDFASVQPRTDVFGINAFTLSDLFSAEMATSSPLPHDANREKVLGHFEAILNQRLLPSGQVLFFPEHVSTGGGRIYCSKTSELKQLRVRRKIVDATNPKKPPQRQDFRCFSSEPGVDVITPHDLSARCANGNRPALQYCIIGGGRTAMDVALQLIRYGVEPKRLSWVKPRDAWLMNGKTQELNPTSTHQILQLQLKAFAALEHALTAEDVCETLEANGFITRVSETHAPSMFHESIASQDEIKRLGKIHHVIRKGHVHGISALGMILDGGAEPMPAETLYVDCSSGSARRRAGVPVFSGNHIRLQNIRMCQPCLSAAMIASIERLNLSEQTKNAICPPLLTPDSTADLLAQLHGTVKNCHAWITNKHLRSKLQARRIDSLGGFATKIIDIQSLPTAQVRTLHKITPRILANLQMLLEQIALESRQ